MAGQSTETGGDQDVGSTRLSYNTGHGDFCFGRFLENPFKDKGELDNVTPKGLLFDSNNVPFKEMDDFERYVKS